MKPVRMRLPATSANLGPGFDAVGLALGIYLTVEARERALGFGVSASGRDAERVGLVKGNLLLETYRDLAPAGPGLDLVVENGIPLGMGLGSSAAALVAGVLLANHFGELGLSRQEMLEEACLREGHPDNVAACLLGGFTVSAMAQGKVSAASFPWSNLPWKIFVALPTESLATEKARALLPDSYSRADAVANVQATGLLVSAFAQGRADLLEAAMRDRLHQPYREQACPLLPRLLTLTGTGGVHGVALSGAGPSVLLIASGDLRQEDLRTRVREAAGLHDIELLETLIAGGVEDEEVGSLFHRVEHVVERGCQMMDVLTVHRCNERGV